MAKYVISDLHGEYDMFMKMLELISFSDEDELYILGDILDRGANPIKIIDYIVTKNNIVWIKGNHDEMLVDYVDTLDFSLWAMNGGHSTLEEILLTKSEDYIQALAMKIKRLPLYKIVDNYVLVHAGAYYSPMDDGLYMEEHLNSISEDFLLWDRSHIGTKFNSDKYTLICGHTVTFTINGQNKIIFDNENNKIMIDCGATFEGGQLGCLRLDDLKEFYITKRDVLEGQNEG